MIRHCGEVTQLTIKVDCELAGNIFLDRARKSDISLAPIMAWATPQFTRPQINAAAKAIIANGAAAEELDEAYVIVNNWRAIHSFPLNTLQIGLRRKAKRVDPNSLIAQRIKRLSSIDLKLRRFPAMKLTQMQDIAGCRAIVESIAQVYGVRELLEESEMKHKLAHTDNYIKDPKSSGYRGIHLIYRYYSDKNETYNDLKVEIQLRSKLQHAWATAVETVGTFTRQALKSSQGEQSWLRFFALMGTYLAEREHSAPIPDTPTNRKELKQELQECARNLDVINRLPAYGTALQVFTEPDFQHSDYFLLRLEPSASKVTITGYRQNELERASSDYLAIERAIANRTDSVSDAVLVSVESMTTLRRAYPNYFLDTRVFIDAVKKAIS